MTLEVLSGQELSEFMHHALLALCTISKVIHKSSSPKIYELFGSL